VKENDTALTPEDEEKERSTENNSRADSKKKSKKSFQVINLFSHVVTVALIVLIMFLALLNFTRTDENGVTMGNYSAYNVITGSMEPAISVGDIVVVKKTEKADIKKDDVITFRIGSNILTHRVVEVRGGGNQFITKGDANRRVDQTPDDPRGRPALEYNDVIGVVIYKLPYIGNLVSVFSQTSAWIFVPIIFIAIIILLEIAKNAMKKPPDEKAAPQPDIEREDRIQDYESVLLSDWDDDEESN